MVLGEMQKEGGMIILGVDPGSNVTGYGLIRSDDRQDVLIESGIIELPPKAPLPEKVETTGKYKHQY